MARVRGARAARSASAATSVPADEPGRRVRDRDRRRLRVARDRARGGGRPGRAVRAARGRAGGPAVRRKAGRADQRAADRLPRRAGSGSAAWSAVLACGARELRFTWTAPARLAGRDSGSRPAWWRPSDVSGDAGGRRGHRDHPRAAAGGDRGEHYVERLDGGCSAAPRARCGAAARRAAGWRRCSLSRARVRRGAAERGDGQALLEAMRCAALACIAACWPAVRCTTTRPRRRCAGAAARGPVHAGQRARRRCRGGGRAAPSAGGAHRG